MSQVRGDVSRSRAVGRGRNAHQRRAGAVELPAQPAPVGKDKSAQSIAFLCPNGHRLNSPASLVGRPGQCPHCGVKFLVPNPDEAAPEEPADEPGQEELPQQPPAAETSHESPVATEPAPAAERDEKPSPQFVLDIELAEPQPAEDELPMIDMEEVHEEAVDMPRSHADAASNGAVRAATESHPLADLMASLWSCRSPGALVEVRLVDGELLVPDGYAKELSRRSHGVFAVRQPDGTHTLLAIAWETVSRVSVRGVKALPAEMFEG